MPDTPPFDVVAYVKSLPPEVQAELVRQARQESWRRGDLSYKLHSHQRRIVDALNASSRRKFYFNCSRRIGKTFTLLIDAFQVALKKPGANILYLAPLANQATEIVVDGVKPILLDAPASLKIDVRPHVKEIRFGNGSVIRLKGVNSEHADNLRGGAQDRVYLDECGQMDRLEYTLGSIVLPMTMTTNGRIILASTPAVSPGHDSTHIYTDLHGTGDVIKLTLLDAPEEHVSYATKVEYLLEAKESRDDIPLILAGKMMPKGTTALREYFCESVTDASKAVVPEMREAAQHIIKSHPRPGLFDAYVSMDPGFEDKTGILYAIYDFRAGVISIEDEDLLHRASTNDIGRVILDKEWALWNDQKPLLRVVDDDLRMIADLKERHGLAFHPAVKQDSIGGINLLRSMIGNREIIIDPKCTRLIEQLKNATWNNRATDFARAGENSPDGHYDLVAALKYLVRSVNRHRNPYPANSPFRSTDTFISSRKRPPSPFGPGGGQLDLLGDTPAARRIKGRHRRR